VEHSPSEPCVIYRDADGHRVVHALRTSPVTIGRSSSANICLAWDARVSRMHARLELVGDDPATDWTVVDDGSSRNGSYVNGERILRRAHLREGDGLTVGRTLLVFHVGAGAAGDDDDAQAAARSTQGGVTMFGLPAVTRASLSDSQYRVLLALAGPADDTGAPPQAATDEEIAGRLFLNIETVRAHVKLLSERFGVASLPPEEGRPALVERARAQGLLLPPRGR
jgi:pSer/pThr/pTyr-binding forkhead associated (FHA) protein